MKSNQSHTEHPGHLTIWSFFALLGLLACVEPYEPEILEFESFLVVEGTITNEDVIQEIRLARTLDFATEIPDAEQNATVSIVDGSGKSVSFLEESPGVYRTAQPFRAETGNEYRLLVLTEEGREYNSDWVETPLESGISELYAERTVDDLGVEGVAIRVDSDPGAGTAPNFRYTYEETYKIIAPNWVSTDMVSTPEDGECAVGLVPKQREEQVCYNTVASNTIILANTDQLSDNTVARFPVRFIPAEDYILSHRYSILVKQFVQSDEAQAFYETLQSFSQSESLFSEVQPGFLRGNVSAQGNPEEKVLGFFGVTTVSEKRLFFNYAELFPEEPLPPYVDPCEVSSPPLVSSTGGCVLSPLIQANIYRYIDRNADPDPTLIEGPYFVVPRVCGDCTVLGTTEIPSFWTE